MKHDRDEFGRAMGPEAGTADAEREVDHEIAYHFERTVDELRRAGWSEADAKAEARRRFGDPARYRRALRDLTVQRRRRARLVLAVGTFGRMVADATRGLMRAPALSIAVLVVMALGVGANATMFSLLDRVFLRPPAHIESPEEVRRVLVTRAGPDGDVLTESAKAYPDIMDWWDLDVFADVAAYATQDLTVGNAAEAERRPTAIVSASFFPLLGVRPAVGRFFAESDDRFGAAGVAVLGHAYWRDRFGGDTTVLGRSLPVGDATYTIVGVAPAGFTGVDLSQVDIWLPLHPAGEVEGGGREWAESRGWYWFHTVARVAPGVSMTQAEAAATAVHRRARADQAGYDPNARVELASVIAARTSRASREARVVPWLMGVALMVLLLTCANIANLLLARSIRNERSTAIRLALGVSRARLVGTVVLESVMLALAGGALAVLLSLAGGDLIRTFLLPDIGWREAASPARLLGFSAAVAIGAGLLAGILPAWRSSRPDVAGSLVSSGRGSTRRRSSSRSLLLVAQTAVTVVLLLGTAMFVRSLWAARNVDLGFDPAGVLLVRLEPTGGYPGGVAMTGLYRDALDVLAPLPGVQHAAIATTTPFRNNRGIGSDLRIPGLDSLPRTSTGGPGINAVTGDFFATLGLRVVRGRALTHADDADGAPRVAVVNETMAAQAWPDRDAIGSCLVIRDGPCIRVVGIVENSNRYELEESESLDYYVPLAHAPNPWPPRDIMIRTSDPVVLAGDVQRTLRESLPGVRLVSTQPYRDVVDPKFRSWSLGATLFAAFGLLALVVAAIGLYSVLAFDVAQRRAELGVRSALGARPRQLLVLVSSAGLKMAVAGIATGTVVIVAVARWIEPLLFHVSARDPVAVSAVAGFMVLIALLASGIPGWRAARADPGQALRADQ
jgi:putative ABC transport system permease protein